MTVIMSYKEGVHADKRIVTRDEATGFEGYSIGEKAFADRARRYNVAFTGTIPEDWKVYANSLYGFGWQHVLSKKEGNRIELPPGAFEAYKDLGAVILRTPVFCVLLDVTETAVEAFLLSGDLTVVRGSTSRGLLALMIDVKDGDKVIYPGWPVRQLYRIASKFDPNVSSEFTTLRDADLIRRVPSEATVKRLARLPDLTFGNKKTVGKNPDLSSDD